MKREKIYAAVWNRPIGQVAKSMRVPVETVHDACRALHIPLPPLSYFTNLKAGHAPAKPELPDFDGPQRYTMGPNDEDEREPIVFTRGEHLLSVEDVEILTGRKYKSQQRDQLGAMQIPFALNLRGEPLVPVAAIEGTMARARKEAAALQRQMDMLRVSYESRRSSTACNKG